MGSYAKGSLEKAAANGTVAEHWVTWGTAGKGGGTVDVQGTGRVNGREEV